jgi:hypothetical protein
MLDQRGQLLRAAVGFAGCSMPSYDRALWALRTWLDSWSRIEHVAVGMHRQGRPATDGDRREDVRMKPALLGLRSGTVDFKAR